MWRGFPKRSPMLSWSKPVMFVYSKVTVTNWCFDVDGPPWKELLHLGRSHIPLPCGVGCCHYHLGLAMRHTCFISSDEVWFQLNAFSFILFAIEFWFLLFFEWCCVCCWWFSFLRLLLLLFYLFDGGFWKEVQYFVWGKPVMFVDSKVTVRKKRSFVDGPPLLELLHLGKSHIPSPCGAALLPLPFGNCHETYILSFSIVLMNSVPIPMCLFFCDTNCT